MKWQLKILKKREVVQAEQELRILKDEVAAAHDFLRQNRQFHTNKQKKFPIYLLLGPSRFGKTTILSQAGLNLENFYKQKLKRVTPTKYCSFWFSQDALYIDTAGTYTKPEVAKPRDDLIWQGFIKLLQRFFGKNAIAGVLIILDLPAIAQDDELLKKTLLCVRERTYELAAFIKNLPLHIIFTKCDRISGFSEFFSLFNREERSQPFGIAFSDPREKIDPVPTFEIKFNELLKSLNERVIERIQKSASPQERLLIKSFPAQLNGLKLLFLEVLGKIPSGKRILLSGIYFTSSIQDGAPVDLIKNLAMHAFNFQAKPIYLPEASNNCSYFVEDIFKKIIIELALLKGQSQKKSLLPPFKSQPSYLYATLISGLIIGVSSITGYQSYHTNVAVIDKVKQFLQNEATNDIDSLHETINKLDQVSRSWWLKFGVNETKSLYYKLHKTHQIAFIQMITLQLENNINTMLNSLEATTTRKLYDALRVYLMLGDPKKLDQAYIKIWFNNYWLEHLDDHTKKIKLQQQLHTTLQYPFKIALNQQLIDKARENLSNLPLSSFLYLSLENSYLGQSLNFDSVGSVAKMYTKENFNKIYNKKIPALINNLPQQDWVLDNYFKPQLKTKNDNDIIKTVREIYLAEYISTWEKLATNLVIKIDSQNLIQAAADLNALVAANSPLFKLLEQIKINTNISNAPPAFTKAINTKLQGLNAINLSDLKHHINNLAHYLNTIGQNHDPDQAAFAALINYLQSKPNDHLVAFKNFASYQSPILQIWFQSVAKQCLSVLLNAAGNHINKVWYTTIIPQYQKLLFDKYPLFKDGKSDISLDDFNKFFSPHGIIDSFFNKYIKPFVNIDKTTWTWKNLDGQKINFSQDSLEVFLRAALIQKMFYSHKTLEPKIHFTLTPLSTTPNTQGFTLHLEGQKIIFTNEASKSYNLVWPGPNPGVVTMDFVTYQGKYFSSSQFGPWAWFKTIDKSSVTTTHDTRRFDITFDLNGSAARYELFTPESINPFIPDIISDFRCPDQLN